jgi:transposase
VLPPIKADGLLPPGIHTADWTEIWAVFGTTPHRQALLRGFFRAIIALKRSGCRWVYLDGSFVTAKEMPRDFDACWDDTGVDLAQLDPILLTFDPGRLAQKIKYGGELFPSTLVADPGSASTFLEFFQIHKETGAAKGIIAIDLERLNP